MTRQRSLEDKRILVLEDDFYLASDEKALLEQAGAQVVGPFGSGHDEGKLDTLGHIDAALVDINLGQGPCFHLARSLQQRGIPFLFVTGYDAETIPAELSQVPRIEKPIRERDVITALVKMMESRSGPE